MTGAKKHWAISSGTWSRRALARLRSLFTYRNTFVYEQNSQFVAKLIPQVNFNRREDEKAKEYWANREFSYYLKERPWSGEVARRVLSYEPISALEFGCNAGKNIHKLLELAPSLSVKGIDINEAAIRAGVQNGLDLICGDQDTLSAMEEKCVDVIFTVSVLDHIPNPDDLLANFGNKARKAIILLEPWLGSKGKVIENRSGVSGDVVPTTPFSYSWDIEQRGLATLRNWRCRVSDFIMKSNLGNHYKFFEFSPLS